MWSNQYPDYWTTFGVGKWELVEFRVHRDLVKNRREADGVLAYVLREFKISLSTHCEPTTFELPTSIFSLILIWTSNNEGMVLQIRPGNSREDINLSGTAPTPTKEM